MANFRTKETFEKYQKYKRDGFMSNGCNLCNEAETIKNFKLWKIVDNKLPLDNVAKVNHLLLPKRHTVYLELNEEEEKEFDEIKASYIENEYEIMLEATNRKKSIPGHFHIHLLVKKDEY